MNNVLLTNAAVIVTWALTVGGTVWFLATDRQQVLGNQQVHAEKLVDHETRITKNEERLREAESLLREIAADVRWIRKWSESKK